MFISMIKLFIWLVFFCTPSFSVTIFEIPLDEWKVQSQIATEYLPKATGYILLFGFFDAAVFIETHYSQCTISLYGTEAILL